MATCEMRISKRCKGKMEFWSVLAEVRCCEPCHDQFIAQVKRAGGLAGKVSSPPPDFRSQKQKDRDARIQREEGFE